MRASLAAGTFPLRPLCLGLAALGIVILAQRVVSHDRNAPKAASDRVGGSHSTPAEVQGRWITASSGSIQNWRHSTGVYEGSGHGTSQIYEFDADGNYKYFIYMEVRTNFSWVKLNTSCKGTVDFDGDHFSLHPVAGHISAAGTSYEDRDMKAEDLARWTNTYRWRRETGTDANPRLIVTSEKAGKQETNEFKALTD